jgi:hypothetical protein
VWNGYSEEQLPRAYQDVMIESEENEPYARVERIGPDEMEERW